MKNRKTLPILLKNQHILLIGGGLVALQKAQVLFDNNISFSIITKTLHPKIALLCKNISLRAFKRKDIKKHLIVIDASGNKKVTQKLLDYKIINPLLLNVVDQPKLCDFYFMALTKNAPLQIAVSSSGASPTVAQHFRDRCEALIPEDMNDFISTLQKQRSEGMIDTSKTKEILQTLDKKTSNQVYLVGCGLGDPELLTLQAYKIIKNVDVVLYDHLISKEILDLVPSTTKRIFVGKEKGFHSKPQEEINKLMLKQTKKGLTVARLKSGDPFIFGRGAEELLYLTQKGIRTKVVPGISSAIAAPLMAHIPITARGYTDVFTVVSAHLKGNAINLSWVPLLQNKSHTVIVLMGLSRVNEIVVEAKNLGISKHTPCAIISNASRDNQKSIMTTLGKLAQKALTVQRPAILVFGNVIKYNTTLEKSKKQ